MPKNQNRKDEIRAYAALHNVSYTKAMRAVNAAASPRTDPLSFTTFLRFQVSPESVAFQTAAAAEAPFVEAGEVSLFESMNYGTLSKRFMAFANWVLNDPNFPEVRALSDFQSYVAAAGLSSEMRAAADDAWYDYGSWILSRGTVTADLSNIGRFPTGMDALGRALQADIRFPDTADYEVALGYLRGAGASDETVDCFNALWADWTIRTVTKSQIGVQSEFLDFLDTSTWKYTFVVANPALTALPANSAMRRERGYAVYTGSVDESFPTLSDDHDVWSFELAPEVDGATAVFEAELITQFYDRGEYSDKPVLMLFEPVSA